MAAISSLQISFIILFYPNVFCLFFFDNIISLCIAVREKVESI